MHQKSAAALEGDRAQTMEILRWMPYAGKKFCGAFFRRPLPKGPVQSRTTAVPETLTMSMPLSLPNTS